MRIDIITIFPNQVEAFINEGIFRISKEQGVEFFVHDLRDWATDNHKSVDDKPYGGGAGMVMKVEPIDKALQDIKIPGGYVILTSAKGDVFTQSKAESLKQKEQIVIICGHYEGIDERVAENLVDEEISIGNYVLSGGELPALIISDSVVRLLPGVLGNPDSLKEESHSSSIKLEYPQFTRPEEYKGWKVPNVLLSGDHAKIKDWRKEQSNKL